MTAGDEGATARRGARGQRRNMLAYERTRIASERTLMAWQRTAVALIGFGFSIPKLFGEVRVHTGETAGPKLEPVFLGLFLLALAVGTLTVGTLQHVRLLQRVRPKGSKADVVTLATVSTSLLALVAIYAFIDVVALRY